MNDRSTAGVGSGSDAASYPPPLVAWFTVAVLFFAYIISFVDRMVLGLLIGGGLVHGMLIHTHGLMARVLRG